MERVVVTGLGVVSCVGSGVSAFWNALLAGQSGIGKIKSFDATRLETRIVGEVDDFALDSKAAKRMARFTQFAVGAAQEALGMAGLLPAGSGTVSMASERIGVAVGSGIGGFPFLLEQHQKFLDKGPGRFHPLTVPVIIPNMAAANIAIVCKLHGPNINISTACATGNHNIGTAFDMIRMGRADVMVAGGAESTMTPFALDGYSQLRALSTRNEDPPAASRPFSASRDGFVLAEGAGIVVLEALTHARRRGAEILAEVCGFGMSSDGYHLTAPAPEAKGAAAAMTLALEDAKVDRQAVDYINAHGTSTPLNDALETQAIKTVLGPYAEKTPVSSIKSMLGHSLGASAGLEAVACVLAIKDSVIPPTINLHDPDPELTLDFVPHQARERALEVVLSNAFAFGGHNAVLVLKKYA